MANPKSKILPRILSTFVVVLLFYCIDAFAPQLGGDLSMFGTNAVGAGLGIITVVLVCVAKHRPLESVGVSLNFFDILKGAFVGGCMSVIPTALVFAGQLGVYGVFKTPSLAPGFVTPNSNGETTVMNVLIFAAACGIASLMQELCFRGYVIRSMRPQYPFYDANAVQSALSVALPLVLVARNFLYGYYSFLSGTKMILFLISIILFYVINDFAASFKRGLMARVSGNIWAGFFDNFFLMLLGGSLFIQNSFISTYSAMVRLLLVQVISAGMAFVYYRKQYLRNKKKREKQQMRLAEKREELRQQELNREEDPNLEDLSQKSVKEIMELHNQKIIDSIGSHMNQIQAENADKNLLDLNEAEFDENVQP